MPYIAVYLLSGFLSYKPFDANEKIIAEERIVLPADIQILLCGVLQNDIEKSFCLVNYLRLKYCPEMNDAMLLIIEFTHSTEYPSLNR